MCGHQSLSNRAPDKPGPGPGSGSDRDRGISKTERRFRVSCAGLRDCAIIQLDASARRTRHAHRRAAMARWELLLLDRGVPVDRCLEELVNW